MIVCGYVFDVLCASYDCGYVLPIYVHINQGGGLDLLGNYKFSRL